MPTAQALAEMTWEQLLAKMSARGYGHESAVRGGIFTWSWTRRGVRFTASAPTMEDAMRKAAEAVPSGAGSATPPKGNGHSAHANVPPQGRPMPAGNYKAAQLHAEVSACHAVLVPFDPTKVGNLAGLRGRQLRYLLQTGESIDPEDIEGLAATFEMCESALREHPQDPRSYPQRVRAWLVACFGEAVARDRRARCHRFLEEALELVQAAGCTEAEARQLVEYVYGRPTGEIEQEAGGVMVTLASLCGALDIDMHEAGETELARVWTRIERIRLKQASKPTLSPLPSTDPT